MMEEEPKKPIEVEVDIVMCIRTRKKIKVDDYNEYIDFADGERELVTDMEDCDLYGQTLEQVDIPTKNDKYGDWVIDDLQIFLA